MKIPQSVKVAAASLGLGGAIGLAVALILLGGEYSAWHGDHPKPKPPVAQVLPPTPEEAATPHETVPCVPVQALKPSPKRLKEIAKATGGLVAATIPAPVAVPPHLGEIVAPATAGGVTYPLLLVDGRPYPESPAGGLLWILLEENGAATVIAEPNPPKPLPTERFWQFGSVYEFGGLYGIGQGGDTRARGWAAIEPLRAGRIHLRAEVGVDLRNGGTDGYVMGGAVWRSR